MWIVIHMINYGIQRRNRLTESSLELIRAISIRYYNNSLLHAAGQLDCLPNELPIHQTSK